MPTPETPPEPCSCKTERTEIVHTYYSSTGSSSRRHVEVKTVVDPKCPTHGGAKMTADISPWPAFKFPDWPWKK